MNADYWCLLKTCSVLLSRTQRVVCEEADAGAVLLDFPSQRALTGLRWRRGGGILEFELGIFGKRAHTALICAVSPLQTFSMGTSSIFIMLLVGPIKCHSAVIYVSAAMGLFSFTSGCVWSWSPILIYPLLDFQSPRNVVGLGIGRFRWRSCAPVVLLRSSLMWKHQRWERGKEVSWT